MAKRGEKNYQSNTKSDDRTNIKINASTNTKLDKGLNQNENLESLEEKNYAASEQDAEKRKSNIEKKRFNPLNKKILTEEFLQIENYPLRKQAQICRCIAALTYAKFNNRGRGDTSVNGMIYASRELITASTTLLKKEITPKRLYEFRNAKVIFQRAKKMSVTDISFLPYIYRVGDMRCMKRLEEEEEIMIQWPQNEE